MKSHEMLLFAIIFSQVLINLGSTCGRLVLILWYDLCLSLVFDNYGFEPRSQLKIWGNAQLL